MYYTEYATVVYHSWEWACMVEQEWTTMNGGPTGAYVTMIRQTRSGGLHETDRRGAPTGP